MVSASPVLSVPCLPSCVSLSGGVRLAGLVCALSPFMCLPERWCPFVVWCVRLLGGLVSPSLPLPSCFPLLDGVSAFPRVLSPLVSPLSPFLLPFVGWCVRLPEDLVSPCVRLCHLSPRWMVCPPTPESCLPLSPFLFPFLFPFVGWCQLPGGIVSPFLPLTTLLTLLVFLCWVVCPPSRGSPCLALSPFLVAKPWC